jgi:hypothetical protein
VDFKSPYTFFLRRAILLRLLCFCAATGAASTSLSQSRPSIDLFSAGVRYSAPASWTLEDYPQLNGVLLLAPLPEKGQWRTAILIELTQANNETVAIESLTQAAADPRVSVVKPPSPIQHWQPIMQSTRSFGQTEPLGWASFSTERNRIKIFEHRFVGNLKQAGRRLVISATWDQKLGTNLPAEIELVLKSLRLQ